MGHFVKVFESIIHSTLWQEELHVKVVWITMLAMADSFGEVHASVPGLAKAAGVSIQQCEEALAKFKSPDPYSRSKEDEGRRIQDIDGGWELINYIKYRKLKSEEQERENAAERQRRFRARNASNGKSRDVTQNNPIEEEEGDVEVEVEVEKHQSSPSAPPSSPPPSAPATASPLGGKKKKRRTRDPLPLGRVGGLALEAFEEAVACWPVEITGFNERIRSNETRKIALGNIPQAQRNFLQLIEEGHATAQELYACAWVASNQWKRQGYLWVPHLSTFYGPEKETWVQFLPEARKVLAEQEAQAAREEVNHAV